MDKRRRTRGEVGPAMEEGRDAGGGAGDWKVSASQAKLDELFLHWLALPEAQSYVKSLRELSNPCNAREKLWDTHSRPGTRTASLACC